MLVIHRDLIFLFFFKINQALQLADDIFTVAVDYDLDDDDEEEDYDSEDETVT